MVAKALRVHLNLRKLLVKKLNALAKNARKKIGRFLVGSYYKRLFRKSIFVATLYLESNDPKANDPQGKVQLSGTFTNKPWDEIIHCEYDPFFKCFKAEKVKIRTGSHFKFIVDNGK